MLVFKRDGTMITLEEKIGSGGEGRIYRSAEGCVKIYHKPSTASENLPKIVRLQSLYWQQEPNPEYKNLFKYVLVPRHVLLDRLGRFVGFIMPCLPQTDNMVLISYLDYDGMKLKVFPWDLKTRSQIVYSIVRYTMMLNEIGILPIDLNDQNIFVHTGKTSVQVYFIDTDSYQVERIPARVIAGDIAPPEFFGGIHLADEKSMVYVLAVIVHRIIMDGFSPFQFVRRKDISPFDIKRRGYSPLRYSELKPPKGYPDMGRLGPLKDVIARAIDPLPEHRPGLNMFYAFVEKWKRFVENL